MCDRAPGDRMLPVLPVQHCPDLAIPVDGAVVGMDPADPLVEHRVAERTGHAGHDRAA